jgi:hypothetical protein
MIGGLSSMNTQRTHETRKIGDLISLAMPFNVLAGSHNPAPADGIIHALSQVEGGDPVRSAERVPYSPSHQFAYHQSHPSSFSSSPRRASAQDDKLSTDDKANVAAA